MSYRIVWARSAAKGLRDLPADRQEQIIRAVEAFASAGVGDIKKLKGDPPCWRLRVGVYRVIFQVRGIPDFVLDVLDVGHRRDVYR